MPRALTADIYDRLFAGDRRAAARLITILESDERQAGDIVRRIHKKTGRAHIIGITGAPGAGKSTLVDTLSDRLRERGFTVGVLAIDPTSPFTGGAFLGDRIRMQRRSTDKEVFIRSMGSRGTLGGLSRATADAVKVMDAMGKDVILIETVGVGQAEVDIVRLADTTVVVQVPGMGDEIQSIKAGIMEIGDLFVVNKSDRDGADKTVSEVEMMLMMGLGSEDPRKKQAREAEEAAHHEASPEELATPDAQHATKTGAASDKIGAATEQVKAFMEADTVHAAEHPGAARKLYGCDGSHIVPERGDEVDEPTEGEAGKGRFAFFEELLDSGVWYPPVQKTIAEKAKGIERLIDLLGLHLEWLEESGERAKKRLARAEKELMAIMQARLAQELEDKEHLRRRFGELVTAIAGRDEDPYTGADELLAHFKDE